MGTKSSKKQNYSMQEIAQELGLSRTTVSLCLSGKAGKYMISPKTQERVKNFARKIGFASNVLAQTVASGKNNKIGIMFDFSRKDDSRINALFYLTAKLTQAGKQYYIHAFEENTFIESIITLKGMGISDIVISCKNNFTNEELNELKPYIKNMRLYFNNLMVDKNVEENKNIFLVETDRYKIYHEVADFLYAQGHRRVIAENNNIRYLKDYSNFDSIAKLSFQRVNMITYISEYEVGRTYGREVIEYMESARATAVIVHNHLYAQGILYELLSNNIKVPEDISIVCFGNSENLDYQRVPLTSIKLPVYKIVDCILDSLIKGTQLTPITKIDSELIIRQSVGPARKNHH